MSLPSEQDSSAAAGQAHADLVARAQKGDATALQDLLCRHVAALRAYVRLHSDAMLRARESCSDMVQSVCRECLGELVTFSFQGEPAFRKWLFQKALSKIVDRRRYWLAERRNAAREEQGAVDGLYASAFTGSQAAMRQEDLQALEACFAELPEDYRRVIVASRLIGQSHAEIATELGKGEGAVRMLLHRALARLARLMQERTTGGT